MYYCYTPLVNFFLGLTMPYNAITTTTDELLSTDDIVVFDDPTQRLLLALSYWVISVIGLAGNGLVIFAVLRYPRLRTVTNAFVANLAVSDFVNCFFVPFAAVPYVTEDMPYPEYFCGVMTGASYAMFGASVANLALIAVNRYVLIIHPKVRYLQIYKKHTVVLMVLTSWIYSAFILCSPPIAGVGALGYIRLYRICGCDTTHSLHKYYAAIRSLLLLIPCLLVAIFCYVVIFWFLIDQMQIKVTRNLSMTMCAFIILIFPYVVVSSIPAGFSFRQWAAVCATFNSCVNPIIYGYGHPQFKEAFHSVFKKNSIEWRPRPFLFWR